MAIINFTHQPLILTVAGDQPTLPSPADLTPDDPGWDHSSNILIGQFAYNNTDDKWYYRGSTVGIQEFQIDPGTNTLFGLFDTDITSPVDGAILRFNTSSGSWEDADTIDADTLENKDRQSIIDDSKSLISEYDVQTGITGVSSSTGWFAISRWKSLDMDFESVLMVEPGGGLNFDFIKISGYVDSVDPANWNVLIQSTNNVYFTKVKLTHETVLGIDYTYLWVYKDIANTETFSVITKRSEYKFDSDNDYTYESLGIIVPTGLTNIRSSSEYDISSNIINKNNIIKVDNVGNLLCNSIQTDSTDPKTKIKKLAIGTWDMDTTDELTVGLPAGITHEQVIDARVLIYNNTNTESAPLMIDGYWFVQDTDEIVLVRNTNGYYDSSDFNGVTDRGIIFLTIEI